MKDYNEMAESVLKRRDRYVAKRSRQMKKMASALSCFCIVALLGAGVIFMSPRLDTGISNEQLDGDSNGYGNQEKIQKQNVDEFKRPEDLSEIRETDTLADDTLGSYNDVPVQGEPGNTGALVSYEAVWGGSYMDAEGHWNIWLTENTPENQKKVFERNPDLLEDSTIFKTADYSLAYLTELMAEISKAMGNKELPFVTTAALREEMNRVVVTMTMEDTDSVEKVLAFDAIGGAIEIRYASGYITDEVEVKGPAK